MRRRRCRTAREDLLEASGEETPFREYFVPVWRWRWLILGVSILCGAVTFGLMKRLPLVYEASTKLILAPPKALQAGEVELAARYAEEHYEGTAQYLIQSLSNDSHTDG